MSQILLYGSLPIQSPPFPMRKANGRNSLVIGRILPFTPYRMLLLRRRTQSIHPLPPHQTFPRLLPPYPDFGPLESLPILSYPPLVPVKKSWLYETKWPPSKPNATNFSKPSPNNPLPFLTPLLPLRHKKKNTHPVR